ncbi:unnamed protein product [Euphydryas editha]|uniref:Uncharacterized protein n=1 Tax=Euphydryas editha TaxID=104508 RepID=A0AAU9TAX4_EUPED|nr:unnamed protein product [Euphydryas editha]
MYKNIILKIQEVDDSFFEKFGSILKQASQKAALEESTPLAPLKEVEEQDGEKVVTEVSESRSVIRDSDSGNETLLDTDSEPEDPEKVDLYVEAIGWNYFYIICSYRASEEIALHSITERVRFGYGLDMEIWSEIEIQIGKEVCMEDLPELVQNSDTRDKFLEFCTKVGQKATKTNKK